MSKHKCGSCRFFQEARLAGSGWCHHPQRRTTNDVMIMVRRNELACRDEWSHDLWTPIDAKGGGGVTPSPDRFPDRREPPATPAEIAAVVQARATPGDAGGARAMPEDVVVGETRVIAETERDWTWQSDDAAASRVVDTRAAIIKARETYRDRTKSLGGGRSNERAPLSPSPEGGDVPSGDGASATDAASAAGPPVDPLVRVRPSAPSLRLSRPAETRGHDEVPSVDPEFDLSIVARRRVDGDPSAEGEETRAVASADGSAIGALGDARVEPAAVEAPVAIASIRRIVGNGRSRGEDRRRSADHRPPEPSLVSVALERTSRTPVDRAPTVEAVPEPDLSAERREEATTLLHGRRGPFRHDPPPVPAHEVAGRWGTVAADEQPPADDLDHADEQMAVELADDEPSAPGEPRAEDIVVPMQPGDRDQAVDLTIRVAPDLPRTCRMCRDYRPAEGGARGWCANEWAFTHRRVVDPEERMPCETTLGSWWLPVDAVWLGRTDVSSHGQPTPILDAVVAHHRGERLRRGGS